MALAILDDVLGIVVIALFYGSALYWPALIAVVIVTAALVGAKRIRIRTLWSYGIGYGWRFWIPVCTRRLLGTSPAYAFQQSPQEWMPDKLRYLIGHLLR